MPTIIKTIPVILLMDMASLKNKNALIKTHKQVRLAMIGPAIESSLFLYINSVIIKLKPYVITASIVLLENIIDNVVLFVSEDPLAFINI